LDKFLSLFNNRVGESIVGFCFFFYNKLKFNSNKETLLSVISNLPIGAILTVEETYEYVDGRKTQTDIYNISRELHEDILRGIRSRGIRGTVCQSDPQRECGERQAESDQDRGSVSNQAGDRSDSKGEK
jgi:hypothetical protein